MILVLALIVASTSIGVIAERRNRESAHAAGQAVVTLLLWVLAPFVVLFVGPHLSAGGGLGIGIGFAYLLLACLGGLAFLIGDRVLGLTRPVTGSVVCAVILSNTGYLGVPLSGALLGHDAITDAVAWDALVSSIVLYVPAFAVGAALGTRAGDTTRQRAIAFFTRNPVLFALIVGLMIPKSWSPDALFSAAKWIAGFGVLPLGFFLLGVNLMEEREDEGARSVFPPFSKPVGVVCGLRLLLAPALLALLVILFGVGIPDAFYLQAAMPSGINTLVVAHVFGLDMRTAAGAIAWSTALAIIGATVLAFVL